ncbi:WD repeat-containing protein 6 [Dimargaris xerosporica]|nr:WD repeat-containing protein 6 [Dimargaris xerosporica]
MHSLDKLLGWTAPNAPYELRSLALHAPITAVEFINDRLVLAASGALLRVYDTATPGTVVEDYNALGIYRVHGVVPRLSSELLSPHGQRWYAVYGAKAIRLVQLDYTSMPDQPPTATLRGETSLLVLTDWILDVQWLYDSEDTTDAPIALAVALAHNQVEIYRLDSFECIARYQCMVQSIIYSARFFGHTLKTLQLAAGTVFNEALLWSATAGHNGSESLPSADPYMCPVTQRFIGHEGVIFNLRFNQSGTMLATVSDDRTIRLWQIAPANSPTGSSSDAVAALPVTLFGHQGRVWDCLILNRCLVSIAEDTTCRVWSYDPYSWRADEPPRPLVCWRGHQGKSIWCVATDPAEMAVVTGGGDGGIRLWSLQSVYQQLDKEQGRISAAILPALALYGHPTSAAATRSKPEFIRNFAYLSGQTIGVVTNHGYILTYDYATSNWTTIGHEPELMGYAMVTALPLGHGMLCGTINGAVIWCNMQPGEAYKSERLVVSSEQIFNIHASPNATSIEVLVVVIGQPVIWLRFEPHLGKDQPSLLGVAQLSLPPTTLANSFALELTQRVLVIGSREGAVAVYDLPASVTSTHVLIQSTTTLFPLLNLRRVHGKDAITSLLISSQPANTPKHQISAPEALLTTAASLRRLVLYTGGRDGTYRQFSLVLPMVQQPVSQTCLESGSNANALVNDEPWATQVLNPSHPVAVSNIPLPRHLVTSSTSDVPIQLELLQRNRVTKGWIEGLTLVDDQLLVSVFYRKRFVVHNASLQYDPLVLNCGGGHRKWSFSTADANLASASFLYLRKEQVYAYFSSPSSATTPAHTVLQTGTHGREIRCAKILPWAGQRMLFGDALSQAPISIIATGSEDGSIRLMAYGSALDCTPLVTVRRHASVVRCLAWQVDYDQVHLFTAGGYGELRCWRVVTSDTSSLASCLGSIQCLEVAAISDSMTHQGIRIMDLVTWTMPDGTYSPTVRMTAAVYSDATVRLWAYTAGCPRLQLVAMDTRSHSHCILSVGHLVLCGPNAIPCHLLVTGSTDGQLRFFDIAQVLDSYRWRELQATNGTVSFDCAHSLDTLLLTYKVHQSGVNSLAMWSPPNQCGRITVASGGDDNCLTVSLFQMTMKNSQVTLAPSHVEAVQPFAHASAIQAVAAVNSDHVITVATDQRINLWRIDQPQPPHPLSAILVGAHFSHVADPSTAHVDCSNGRSRVIVGGIGLQMFALDERP